MAAVAPAKPKIGIHPFGTGDPDFKPDYSKLPPELQKVFAYIDTNIDDHAENIQNWIKQPSISNSGEGIPNRPGIDGGGNAAGSLISDADTLIFQLTL